MEMAITADPITSDEASQLGLVSRLVEKGEAVDAALELAARISKNAPLAVAVSKQLTKAAVDLDEAAFWKLQNELMPIVFASNDAKEGPLAFAEKRAPNWTGE